MNRATYTGETSCDDTVPHYRTRKGYHFANRSVIRRGRPCLQNSFHLFPDAYMHSHLPEPLHKWPAGWVPESSVDATAGLTIPRGWDKELPWACFFFPSFAIP